MDSPNKLQKYKKKYKSTHNLVIFRATDSRFCMEVHMYRPTKWESTKSTKIQKYKSTKVKRYKSTKRPKNENKMLKHKKNKK